MSTEQLLAGKKVAVLVETEYIHDEIEYYLKKIPELGGEIDLLCYLWGGTHLELVNDIDNPNRPVTDVYRLVVDKCVSKVQPTDYDIIICAANYVSVRLREVPPMGSMVRREDLSKAPAVKFFAEAMRNKCITKAAMCHALWLLTPVPELLRDRRVICHTVVQADILNAGAIFVPDPSHVVVDDDLVTARSFADVEGYFKAIVKNATERSTDECTPVACTGVGHDSDCDKDDNLFAAIAHGNAAAVYQLLAAGADPNDRCGTPYTPLMLAAGHGNAQITAALLSAGADVHVLDSSLGATPLHKAAQGGVIEVARLLIEAGAFVNVQSAVVGHTPLVDAIWSKNVSMVEFLLAQGAITNIPGHHGAAAKDFVGDAVLWTAGFTNPEQESWGRAIRQALEKYQKHGDQVALDQCLMQAVLREDLDEVKNLVAQGADVDQVSPVIGGGNDGQTPLLVACFLGNVGIVDVLLEAGANPRIVDYLMKATPGHKAAYAGRPEALRRVIQSTGLNLNAQGPYNGFTALHDAVWHGHTEAVQVLLDVGVRTDLPAHDGKTPYQLAVKLGYSQIAEMIRSAVEESPQE